MLLDRTLRSPASLSCASMMLRFDDSYGVWQETDFVYDRYGNRTDVIDLVNLPG